MNLFETNFLFANLIWSSVGIGYCIYGRRQRLVVPFLGGVAMVLVSCLVGSALLMSLICLAVMTAVYWLLKQGV